MTKYGNTRVVEDGYTFDSKAEFRRYQELKLLEKAGEIYNLQVHVPFPLVVEGILVCTYEADFVYQLPSGSLGDLVVEDVKGYRTDLYRLKKKLMYACKGIKIQEVRA
jgi:hypothetical protein